MAAAESVTDVLKSQVTTNLSKYAYYSAIIWNICWIAEGFW